MNIDWLACVLAYLVVLHDHDVEYAADIINQESEYLLCLFDNGETPEFAANSIDAIAVDCERWTTV